MEAKIIDIKKKILYSKISIYAIIIFLAIITFLLISISNQLSYSQSVDSYAARNNQFRADPKNNQNNITPENESQSQLADNQIENSIEPGNCLSLGPEYNCLTQDQCASVGGVLGQKCSLANGLYDPGYCCKIGSNQPPVNQQGCRDLGGVCVGNGQCQGEKIADCKELSYDTGDCCLLAGEKSPDASPSAGNNDPQTCQVILGYDQSGQALFGHGFCATPGFNEMKCRWQTPDGKYVQLADSARCSLHWCCPPN